MRALVGGRNYAESQFNRAVAAKRQPGSAFKPFVYLTAIERGLTPDTIREDKPIAVKGWRPENYSHEYFGPVPLRKALALSLNTVSVRLTLEFGPSAVVRTAHRLGIASKLEPNASIALGTSEVSVLELVGAYATFANGGMEVTPHVVERVRSANGKLLYQHQPENLGRIVEAPYVGMMNTMMRDTLLIGTAHKAELPGWPAAGKTGTSQDFRDAWFIGYTGHLVDWRLARQRRQLADQENHRRRPAGRNLEQVHESGAPGRAGRGLARRVERTADRRPRATMGNAAGAGTERNGARQTDAGARRRRRRHRQLADRPAVRPALILNDAPGRCLRALRASAPMSRPQDRRRCRGRRRAARRFVPAFDRRLRR